MAPATSLPLYYPGDVRHAFVKDEGVRRIARVAGWQQGTRVLHLGCGLGWPSLCLAEQVGCRVVAADDDETALDALRGLVKARSLGDAIDVRRVELASPGFAAGEFEGVLVDNRLTLRLEAAMGALRRLLAPSGKLALLYPVKVGRFLNQAALGFWEEKLGEPLRTPRECLQVMELAGLEPQSVETLSDQELEEFYKGIEPSLGRLQDAPRVELIKQEIALHRSQAGKASVSFALMVGRRKEPGERPPPSRTEG